MKKQSRHLSSRLFLSAMIFFCISVLVLGMYYFVTVRRVYNNGIYRSQQNNLYNADEYITSIAMEISDAVDSITQQETTIQQFVQEKNFGRYLNSKKLSKIVSNITAEHSNIVGLSLLIPCDGEMKYISAGDYDSADLSQYMKQERWPKDYELHMMPREKSGNILAIKRPRMQKEILVAVEITPIFFGKAADGENIVITDGDGKIVYRQHIISEESIELLLADIVQNDATEGTDDSLTDTTISYSKSRFNGLYIFNIQRAENLDDNLKRIFSVLGLMIVLTLILMSAIAWFLARLITGRITELNSFVKHASFDESKLSLSGRHPLFVIPIQKQIIIYHIASCGIPFILAVVVMFGNMIDVVEDRTRRVFEKYVLQTQESFHLYQERYIKKAKVLALDADIIAFLQNPAGEYSPDTDEVINLYNSEGVQVYPPEKFLSDTRMVKSEGVFTDRDRIAFSAKVTVAAASDKDYNDSVIGYVELVQDKNSFRDTLAIERSSDLATIYILDEQHKICLSNHVQSEETFLPEKMFSEAGTYSLPVNGGKLFAVMDYREIASERYRMILEACLIILLMLAALAGYTAIYSKHFCRPIHVITGTIKKAADGEFDSISVHTGDEIEELARSFHEMLHQIQDLIAERCSLWEKQRELYYQNKEAQLNILQSQINPHFIYNTLESIKWLMLSDEPEKADDMITRLAELFRQSIRKGESEILLKEELDSLDAYNAIQLVRYEDSLEIIRDIRVDTTAYKITKMCLQPLIENAVTHGVEPKGEKGRIQILIEQIKDTLVVEVTDNGVGMSPARLDEVRNVLRSNTPPESETSGVGLANVNRRIQLMYGEEYGLSVNSETGVGTCITLRIPCGGDYV